MVSKKIHFVYLYGKDTPEFTVNHLGSVKTNYLVNKDFELFIYSNDIERLRTKSFGGRFIDKHLSNRVHLVQLSEDMYPKSEKLRNTPYIAHLADYIRLKILYTYGGVYLDVDSIAYSPFTDHLDFDKIDTLVSCWEYPGPSSESICNGVMIAPKDFQILNEWMNAMEFGYSPLTCVPKTPSWTLYSVQYLYKLWLKYPESFTVLDYHMFEPFTLSYEDTVRLFFINRMDLVTHYNPMQVHLWETRNKDILKLFKEEYFEYSDSTYARLVSGVLLLENNNL